MTHVLVLSAKLRRSETGVKHERVGQTLDIGNMFGPTFGLKNSKSFQFSE
jgi:hypothetical protein